MAADVPVLWSGGENNQGKRVVNLALDAEFKGAMGYCKFFINEMFQNKRNNRYSFNSYSSRLMKI